MACQHRSAPLRVFATKLKVHLFLKQPRHGRFISTASSGYHCPHAIFAAPVTRRHSPPLFSSLQGVGLGTSSHTQCLIALRRSRKGPSTAGWGPLRALSTLSLPQIPTTEGSWDGLPAWRAGGVDERRTWAEHGPEELSPASSTSGVHVEDAEAAIRACGSLAECGRLVLTAAEPEAKAALTHAAFRRLAGGELPVGTAEAPPAPARPAHPVLVPSREVPVHDESPLPLSAHLLHNVAHIELNAIDLAWDTLVRFSGLQPALPAEFYHDFARVADDESRHLSWCLQRLQELGHSYGDMPAHNLLWEGAANTSGDITARLVAIPCVQEARGLDAGPKLTNRLAGSGDHRSAAIVARISEEELAHVAVGVTWFSQVCGALQQDPKDSFHSYVASAIPGGVLRGPFNHKSRAAAGLQRDWYDHEARDTRPGAGGPAAEAPEGAGPDTANARRRRKLKARSWQAGFKSKKQRRKEERARIKALSQGSQDISTGAEGGRTGDRMEGVDASPEAASDPNIKHLQSRLTQMLVIEAVSSGQDEAEQLR